MELPFPVLLTGKRRANASPCIPSCREINFVSFLVKLFLGLEMNFLFYFYFFCVFVDGAIFFGFSLYNKQKHFKLFFFLKQFDPFTPSCLI